MISDSLPIHGNAVGEDGQLSGDSRKENTNLKDGQLMLQRSTIALRSSSKPQVHQPQLEERAGTGGGRESVLGRGGPDGEDRRHWQATDSDTSSSGPDRLEVATPDVHITVLTQYHRMGLTSVATSPEDLPLPVTDLRQTVRWTGQKRR